MSCEEKLQYVWNGESVPFLDEDADWLVGCIFSDRSVLFKSRDTDRDANDWDTVDKDLWF